MSVADKLTTIAENQQRVYNKGLEDGKSQGDSSEENAFWENLKRKTQHTYLFYEWNQYMFNPPAETLALKGSSGRAFYGFNTAASGVVSEVSLIELLNNCKASLDTSNVTSCDFMFGSANISEIPTLDFTNVKSLQSTFNNSSVQTIEKIILKEDGTQTFNNIAFNCTKLKDIEFEGTIGTNIWFDNCTQLTAKSLYSIMTHLSTTSSGQTLSLPGEDAVRATYDAGYGEGAWDTIVAEKGNWTITCK